VSPAVATSPVVTAAPAGPAAWMTAEKPPRTPVRSRPRGPRLGLLWAGSGIADAEGAGQ
jgi:hypothetical protein